MYEFISRHRVQDVALERTLRSAFDRVAEAPNAAPALAGLIHEDGGHHTFTAQFESFVDAQAFRTAVAADPQADAHVTPRLEDLELLPPKRIAMDWDEPPPDASGAL
ncbi:MAG TPA: hypothetical protein VF495_06625 [Phenylobacterium sp.]|jgi:hypothetical protein